MIKIFTFIISGILFFSNAYSQMNWVWQNPIPSGNDIYEAKFLNKNTGFAAGDFAILKTTNGGANWNIVKSDTCYFRCIHIFDSNNIIVAGNAIYKSSDGGSTWNFISRWNFIFKSISFFNPNTGYALSNSSEPYKTTNGGNSWFYDNILPGSSSQLKFISEHTGFCVGYIGDFPVIYKTADAGNTWGSTFLSMPHVVLPAVNIDFLNSDTGYVLAGGYPKHTLFKTTDRGYNWYPVIDDLALNIFVTSFSCTPTGKLFAASDQNGIIAQIIERNSRIIHSQIGSRSLFVNFQKSDTGYAVGTGGQIYKFYNEAEGWVCQSSVYSYFSDFNKITFFDSYTGLVVGGNGFYLKTFNGGLNWSPGKISSEQLYSCEMRDGQNWYIGTTNSKIFRTTNAGRSWDTIYFPPAQPGYGIVCGIKFLNENTGNVSVGGQILRTTNGGLNWDFQQGTINIIPDFDFINSLTGYYVDPYLKSYINRTTNGGQNWSNISIIDSLSTSCFKFVDESTGYLVGFPVNSFNSYSKIYKSTNGGSNWNLIFTCLPCYKLDVNSSGKIITDKYLSTDGGDSWVRNNLYFNGFINAIKFINSTTAFVAGTNGNLIKTTNAGGVFVAHNTSTVPDNFHLHQNYPNPFNPNTVISFQLAVNSFVNLKVFDINGKEVSELVNEKLNAGEYKIDFNGAMLPSGVYYYKMATENFSETKKMILVK